MLHQDGSRAAWLAGLNEERVLQLLPQGSYDAYIQKPFDTDAFLALVGRLSSPPPAP